MLIHVDSTPNPAVLKFVPEDIPATWPAYQEFFIKNQGSLPLVQKIFAISTEVQQIFFGKDFVSVTKSEEALWDFLRPLVIHTLVDHFLEAQAQETYTPLDPVSSSDLDLNDPLVQEIHAFLEEHIQPAVAKDGGMIQLQGYSQGIVYVKLMGACSGCPSSTITLKQGIENMMKHYIPQVTEVQAL